MRPIPARWPTSSSRWPRASTGCPAIPALPGRSAEQRLVLADLTEVRLVELDALVRADESGRRPRLERLLNRLEADLPVLSEMIAASYFSHLQTSRHLGSPGPRDVAPPRDRDRVRPARRRHDALQIDPHDDLRLHRAGLALPQRVPPHRADGIVAEPAVERAADQPAPLGDDRADRLLRQHGDLRHDRGAAPATERDLDQRDRADADLAAPGRLRRLPGKPCATSLRHECSPDVLAASQFGFDSPYVPDRRGLRRLRRAVVPGRAGRSSRP